jgi:integrase
VGKLYRREGSPYWWARWHDAGGELRRESTKSSDRRVATLFLSAREAEAIKESAGLPVARRIALADAIAQYLDAHRPPVWSEKWHYTCGHWFRSRIILDLGGAETGVDQVDRDRADACRRAWLHRDLAPPTVNRLCAVASGFFRWASDPDRRYALENPFSRLKRFAEVRATPPPVSDQDLVRFLAAIPNETIRRAAALSLDTGLRLSEVRRIRPEDIRGNLLHVVSSYGRGLTKNKRERWLLLTPRAREALAAQGEDVFTLLPKNTRKAIRAAQVQAKLAYFTWRDQRHYALTRAARAGVKAHDLRGMAGWAGDESARYVHPEAEGMRPFIDAQCAPGVSEASPSEKNTERSGDNHTKDKRDPTCG